MLMAGALCGALWLPAAAAQDTASANQEPSVADAARKARAERKEQPPPKKVWTDDNLPKAPHEAPEAEPGAAAEASGGEKGAVAEDANKKQADLEAKWRQRFADAHKKLDDDQKDLDLMERELSLKRQQYYSDPNTAMREQYQYPAGRGGDINDLVKKIDDKKQQIEKDKQTISDLEDELRKAGLPSGWSRP
jgi:DNA repair exonuclease SbcCD ATPase subunit